MQAQRVATARRLVASLLVGLVVAACAGDGPAGDDAGDGGLRIVATTSILGDVTRALVAGDGEVEVLMPPGADPHGFAPSAAQAAAVREADLVVANGLGLEESLTDLIGAAREEGVPVLELAPQLDPIPLRTGVGDAGDEASAAPGDPDDHAEDGLDPHVWFDPIRMADGVTILADALAEASGGTPDRATWTRRGADYAAQLVALDEELRSTLATIPAGRRVLVTNHDAIGYLAARYDLDLVGTVVPGGSTLAGASAARLAQLAAIVREAGVPAIFAENTADDRLADALAREVGERVAVVSLYTDALGPPGSGADSYPGLLRTDARLIADALTR